MRPYQIFDVFTDAPLAGNPLAVVWQADDLAPERMQAIAAEFNLPETIFLFRPMDRGNTAAARIFTPVEELPFAGHPTVGGTVALAPEGGPVRLELSAGLVAADVTVEGGVARSTFAAPRLPEVAGATPDAAAVARAVGLVPEDIGFPGGRLAFVASGPSFTVVPVRDVAALGRAVSNRAAWDAFPAPWRSAYLVTPDGAGAFRCRMFAPFSGIEEDPATGSAAVAFAALLAEGAADGTHRVSLRQGVEMRRPSTVGLTFTVAGGRPTEVQLDGSAVLVAEGRLMV